MRELRPPPQEPVRTRPARRPPPRLAQALTPHLARLAKASGAMDPRLAAEWADIAGPDLAPLCRPIRIIRRGRGQALELSVRSGAAAMKLRYAQEALLGRVRQRLGLPHLTAIVLREGADERSWASRRMAAPKPRPADEAPARKPEGLDAALEAMRQTIHRRNS